MASLLAVDAGVRAGLALFGRDGRLRWYRSRNYGSLSRLKRAARVVVGELDDLEVLAVEGGGGPADAWLKEATRRRLPALRVDARVWRGRLLLPRTRRTGSDAKETADGIARRVIEWSGAARPTSLRHDAAEAILVGLWAVVELGWLESVPEAVSGG